MVKYIEDMLPQFTEVLETLEDLYILVEVGGCGIKSIKVISLSSGFEEEIELVKARQIINSIIL